MKVSIALALSLLPWIPGRPRWGREMCSTCVSSLALEDTRCWLLRGEGGLGSQKPESPKQLNPRAEAHQRPMLKPGREQGGNLGGGGSKATDTTGPWTQMEVMKQSRMA